VAPLNCHDSPARQFVVTLSGTLAFQTGTGEHSSSTRREDQKRGSPALRILLVVLYLIFGASSPITTGQSPEWLNQALARR
jgi:hypothetical protein